MHCKFAAAKVMTIVVSDSWVVWDFDCQRLWHASEPSPFLCYMHSCQHGVKKMRDVLLFFAGFHLTFTTSTHRHCRNRTKWMSIGEDVLSTNNRIFESKIPNFNGLATFTIIDVFRAFFNKMYLCSENYCDFQRNLRYLF